MKIVVVANDEQKIELLQQGINEHTTIEWHNDLDRLNTTDTTACIDLLFSNDPEGRTSILKELSLTIVIVNYVNDNLEKLPASFVRINGWRSFLKRTIVEAACKNEKYKTIAEKIFNCFNKKVEWTDDIPGFVTPRIVSTIINEGYFALQENISTKEEIDLAMKMGTNYPYGPFEWCNLIGIKNVYALLQKLSNYNSRYQPSELLKTEAIL